MSQGIWFWSIVLAVVALTLVQRQKT
jgi:hypothetical protein